MSHSVLALELSLQGGGTRDTDVHSDDVICTTSDKVLPTCVQQKHHRKYLKYTKQTKIFTTTVLPTYQD